MTDFYLKYKKAGRYFLVDTNLTGKMLQDINDYDETKLIALSLLLKRINAKGDKAKIKYKELCEKNGNLFCNGAVICYGKYEENAGMNERELYANAINTMSQQLLGKKIITE